jgi:hypothetical protein
MPALREQQYLFVRTRVADEPLPLARRSTRGELVCVPVLRYSSPWTWVIALAVSSAMWVGIGWIIWKLV